MKVLSIRDAQREPFIHPLFTGPEVSRQDLAPDSGEFTVNVVNFGRGVRNRAHAHDSEQILIVTAGKGFVATEGEEHPLSPGDVVLVPAGEVHWHGAAPRSEFSHIFVQRRDSVLTQIEE